MNAQLEAARELHQFLSELNIDYVVIGGIAVQKWGNPRFTRDADITIASPLTSSEATVNLITSHFTPRSNDPVEFARKTRMVLVTASNGIDVDISLALPGYEEHLFENATDFEIEFGKYIRLCSAEDLIILKAVAARPQDLSDIQGVVVRQNERLRIDYIREWLQQFADLLARADIIENFEAVWQKR